MWFIGVEVEQETSTPAPKKKILDPPLVLECLCFAKETKKYFFILV